MDYGRHLTDAFHLTWRQRSWWPLGGLLAITVLLQSLAMRLLFIWLPDASRLDAAELFDFMDGLWQPARLIAWLVMLLVVGLLIWLVTAVAEGGLIWGIDRQQNGYPAPLRSSLVAGWRFLIRLVAIDTLIFLPLFLLLLLTLLLGSGGLIGALLLLAGEIISYEQSFLPLAGLGLLLLCLGGLAWPLLLVTFLFRLLAFRAAIVENLPAAPSIRRAWQLIRHHWMHLIIVALILWVVRRLGQILASFVVTPVNFIAFRRLFDPARTGSPLHAHGPAAAADVASYLLHAALLLFGAIVWTIIYLAITAPQPAGPPQEVER
jgi:hypothetical protein